MLKLQAISDSVCAGSALQSNKPGASRRMRFATSIHDVNQRIDYTMIGAARLHCIAEFGSMQRKLSPISTGRAVDYALLHAGWETAAYQRANSLGVRVCIAAGSTPALALPQSWWRGLFEERCGT